MMRCKSSSDEEEGAGEGTERTKSRSSLTASRRASSVLEEAGKSEASSSSETSLQRLTLFAGGSRAAGERPPSGRRWSPSEDRKGASGEGCNLGDEAKGE